MQKVLFVLVIVAFIAIFMKMRNNKTSELNEKFPA